MRPASGVGTEPPREGPQSGGSGPATPLQLISAGRRACELTRRTELQELLPASWDSLNLLA